MIKDNTIIIKKGVSSGKTVGIFCGVHGNEEAGIEAVKRIIKNIEIISGKVYFVFANPEAIRKKVRYIEKNLNRCFFKNNKGKTIEDRRAVELLNILDECEILLDIHASNNSQSVPFVICEKDGYDIAKKLDFEIISSGWDEFEPGATDGYMFNNGKIGICLECGSILDYENGSNLAEKSIYQFLTYTQNIISDIKYDEKPKRFLKIIRMERKETKSLSFSREYKDFEILIEGEIFAKDGEKEYVAGKDECIIFPNSNKKIGEEIFLIGKFI
ncbi:MAG: succinylglutamate desuccinylase/aspartoacylase family protein [Candidatus Moraniibacteriota bacterium]